MPWLLKSIFGSNLATLYHVLVLLLARRNSFGVTLKSVH
jgi:hypothetical protein